MRRAIKSENRQPFEVQSYLAESREDERPAAEPAHALGVRSWASRDCCAITRESLNGLEHRQRHSGTAACEQSCGSSQNRGWTPSSGRA